MATSASFHGVVGLQNGSKNLGDTTDTPEIRDIRVNVCPIIDDEGKSAHYLHLFANDDLQPLPNGARTFQTAIIAVKVSRSPTTNGGKCIGQLIDFIITAHTAYPELKERAKQEGKAIHTVLLDVLEKLRHENHVDTYTELTKHIHCYPDFHGNRFPNADPRMRGSIESSIADLARKYLQAELHDEACRLV
ncbi:hypothetical protein DFJ58DRAFT_732263 [Suillus subalutaceus]|uniref:uncharacterized protein n=1 Tax=Suillus subalutaceus TaxID=48586 RepID=UPI001B86433C|nr:uncharacterized protein DFJ58DRAFT_732263 [Suillus subalutaceus]KAG1841917.1 hypothetical protein DFJ58DRAFT_732263 [Suillus subalutaceus]